jgi:uncharacterized protein (DUF362 family)
MTDYVSAKDSSAGGPQASPQAPAVAILPCPDHADLAGTLISLRASLPSLLPSSLPRRVLIKPNLCDIVSWESGVTTDPAWLAVLAETLRAIRTDVEILVVESDAVSAYKTFRSCDETFERLGYADAARRLGIKLVNLSNTESIEIALPGVPAPLRIALLLLEEFYFISIANLKVHPYTRMTAILKNSLGLVSDADIASLHPYLSQMIGGLHLLCPPDLCVVDGRIGLEGHGPILGDPVNMDSIIFSNDALTADVAACALMMIPPEEVPYLGMVAKELHRGLPKVRLPEGIKPRQFAFDARGGHGSILLKFASRRFHKRSELFTNRWIDRLVRFKRHPLTFAIEGIPKLVRRVNAR